MGPESENSKFCIACGSTRWTVKEERAGYKLALCDDCGLTFTLNPDYRPELYITAYGEGDDKSATPNKEPYLYSGPITRLELETLSYWLPPPYLTPAERYTLQWLLSNAPANATVIDCGCGAGRFLTALRNTEILGVGVDVSPRLIDLLKSKALKAIKGQAPNFPWFGPEPFALTLFEVLEHMSAPLPLIRDLRKRFPRTYFIASVPSPRRASLLLKGERTDADYPPHHFLRWTADSLTIAFKRAGYSRVVIVFPPPDSEEFIPGLSQIIHKMKSSRSANYVKNIGKDRNSSNVTLRRRVLATGIVSVYYLYRKIAKILGIYLAYRAKKNGASSHTFLVIAIP